MPVTYTNRKGVTYYLCRTVSRTGRPRYVFARGPKGQVMDHIPQGWHISESINGIVSLVKDYPPRILPEEIAVVEAELGRHPKSRNYRVAVKRSRIEVYERIGPDAEQLLAGLARLGLGVAQASDEWCAKIERDARFAPVLRFILADARQRTFYT